MEQRRLPGTRWSHEGDKFAFMDLNINVPQRDDVKLVADEFLGKLTGLDYDVCHGGYPCFARTRSPSFKSAGGFTIRSSPPMRPSSTRIPRDVVPLVRMGLRTAFPPRTTKTASLRTEVGGTYTTGLAAGTEPLGSPLPETKATLAFISGRRYSSGCTIFTFT